MMHILEELATSRAVATLQQSRRSSPFSAFFRRMLEVHEQASQPAYFLEYRQLAELRTTLDPRHRPPKQGQ